MKSSLRWPAVFLMCLVILAAGGCGGGSGFNLPDIACNPDSFTPNYVMNLQSFPTWSSFPVRVYFIPDAGYTTHRQALAEAGFHEWVNATNQTINYVLVNSSTQADITVQFTQTTQDGLTQIKYSGLSMISAPIQVGVMNLPDADIECVAAHEFGHALGINGHSPNSDDLMYPVHVIGTPCVVTQQDLNTMKTGYCHLFGRSCCTGPGARRTGPVQTITIH